MRVSRSSRRAGLLSAHSLAGRQTARNWLTLRLPVFTAITICAVGIGWVASKPLPFSSFSSSTPRMNADNLDQRLQRAATAALGDRRGAVIVVDPQTGRIRAVVNPEIAFAENLPPGSTIKPFTALAALRSGVIDEDSRTLCREKYAHDEFHTTCSHPRDLPPLNPTDAIAYSCNYYFGKVGERLAEADFSATLDEFGFGKASGVNAARESTGLLRRNDWHTQNAIGEGDYLRATPIQLIDAYTALVNGGHLFTPRIATAADFVPELRANVAINPEFRNLILQGMRGAVRYGTAESAKLYTLPIYVFGKTGTATEISGYRSQGWFVGFASALNEDAGDESEFAPDKVKLSVLVFLSRAHGSDAAEVARPIFAEYARFPSETANSKTQLTDQQAEGQPDQIAPLDVTSGPASASPATRDQVRVHLVRENVTRTMPVEDYVRGVVAAEGSLEREPEALKALAIASRTYVLKNLGRHAQDGYDFCTTTHCQRYRPADSAGEVPAAIGEAVASTTGKVLLDSNNELVDSYFSASCGGATANIATLWGGNAPAYLRGVRDEACASEAHHSWTDVISEGQLLQALKTDPRTNIGDRLVSLSVLRQDASGRAELIEVEGNRRITVKGWDFKIIVGRALGWNLLKSSRFTITRSGSKFVFRGSGFGHGLGLCQEGAHVMAERGAGYRQILAKYFPTTHISDELRAAGAADLLWPPSASLDFATSVTEIGVRTPRARTTRLTLASENFRINYPNSIGRRDVESLLGLLQSTRKTLIASVAVAGINAQLPTLEIFINETTGDFVGRTGQPAWAAAATKGRLIDLQPLITLKRRRILETTVRHELVHTVVDVVGHGHAPRWLAEGLALHLAGEGRLVSRYLPRQPLTTAQIEKRLQSARSANEMQVAYAAAYGEVKRLIDSEGEAQLWRRVAQ